MYFLCIGKARNLAMLIGLLLFSSNLMAQGRGEISGRITEEGSGEPLVGVHVFLASRMQGATTDTTGFFVISNLQPGSYKVVATFIGFESETVVVDIEEESATQQIEMALKPAVYALEDVLVTAEEPRAWRRQLKRFEAVFLGSSDNARRTTILNPFVLSFRDDEKGFSAFAGEPLVIENRSTGYRLEFVLERFWEDPYDGLRYTVGTWRFEELTPKNEREREEWLEWRELTFKGSLQHLLWSMVRLRTEEEGFSLLRDFREDGEAPELFLTKYHPVDERTILRKSSSPHEYKMRFTDFIRVYYLREGDTRRLFGRRLPPSEQLSYLKMRNADEVTIHESGYMYTPAGSEGAITVYGYLSELGVADLLPQEYPLQRE